MLTDERTDQFSRMLISKKNTLDARNVFSVLGLSRFWWTPKPFNSSFWRMGQIKYDGFMATAASLHCSIYLEFTTHLPLQGFFFKRCDWSRCLWNNRKFSHSGGRLGFPNVKILTVVVVIVEMLNLPADVDANFLSSASRFPIFSALCFRKLENLKKWVRRSPQERGSATRSNSIIIIFVCAGGKAVAFYRCLGDTNSKFVRRSFKNIVMMLRKKTWPMRMHAQSTEQPLLNLASLKFLSLTRLFRALQRQTVSHYSYLSFSAFFAITNMFSNQGYRINVPTATSYVLLVGMLTQYVDFQCSEQSARSNTEKNFNASGLQL